MGCFPRAGEDRRTPPACRGRVVLVPAATWRAVAAAAAYGKEPADFPRLLWLLLRLRVGFQIVRLLELLAYGRNLPARTPRQLIANVFRGAAGLRY